jgi:5'-methylthioinosine phosphorylase
MTRLAIIAGSGFAHLGLEVIARSPTKTPYGEPSSPILTVRVAGVTALCIARHGEQHAIAPHEINYRANLWALAQHGVRTCIGLNTVGGIAPELGPGELAVPHQLIDYTSGRVSSFGGPDGRVVHIDFTEPFSAPLRAKLAAAARECGMRVDGGVYGVTQGPRLETAAEIDRLARDGCTMVGMTAMPEAALARELGMDYAILAVVVNFAAGRSPTGKPILGEVAESLVSGAERIAAVLARVLPALDSGA